MLHLIICMGSTGMQGLHDYQEKFLNDAGVQYKIQTEEFVSDGEILRMITENSDVVGFTIAEYLPFDEYKLHQMFSEMNIFTE